jgi:Photosynthesis system II assembly factor YCF48
MGMRWITALVGCVLLAGCAASTPGQAGGPVSTPTVTAAPTTADTSTPDGTSASAAAAHCRAAPDRGQAAGSQPTLTGIQFVSPQLGWAVGGDRILATTDGGAHWRVQVAGALGLTSLDFINGSDGWAVGMRRVMVTTDGGAHWNAMPEPCPLIDAVHFVSPSRGFAVAGGHATAYQPVPASGGVLLTTGDGGKGWEQMPAPADVQSACFTDPARGWLGAHGRLYRTVDGGRTWTLATGGVTGSGGQPYLMMVECAGPSAVWALDLGTGAAMNHAPVVGFHAGPAGATAVFADQYFPHPGVSVTAQAPGSYPGPLSAVSAGTAIAVGWCPPCGGLGTAPWDLLTRSGAVISQRGNVGGFTQAAGASFLTPQLGWVVGTAGYLRHGSQMVPRQRIVMTSNGGASWHTEFSYVP